VIGPVLLLPLTLPGTDGTIDGPWGTWSRPPCCLP